ncbi:hypothetical protein CRENBAI_022099 [Crenichthys baileyi]|uniref:Uncharacterized protein n=1 Tax=Crenichthys baileyi TaxID=28760 RepID=A0AAV9SPD2_9TELE
MESKPNKSGRYTTTKNGYVLILCHVPLSINYSLRTTSQAVHKFTYCLLRHGLLLFLNPGLQVIEVLGYKGFRVSIGFRSESAGHCIQGTSVSSRFSPMM